MLRDKLHFEINFSIEYWAVVLLVFSIVIMTLFFARVANRNNPFPITWGDFLSALVESTTIMTLVLIAVSILAGALQ